MLRRSRAGARSRRGPSSVAGDERFGLDARPQLAPCRPAPARSYGSGGSVARAALGPHGRERPSSCRPARRRPPSPARTRAGTSSATRASRTRTPSSWMCLSARQSKFWLPRKVSRRPPGRTWRAARRPRCGGSPRAHREVREPCRASRRARVGAVHAGVEQQAARSRRASRPRPSASSTGRIGSPGQVAKVELLDVEARLGAPDHLHPDVGGRRQRRVAERGLERARLDELDGRRRGARARRAAAGAAARARSATTSGTSDATRRRMNGSPRA